jgi:hypothetical protein
MRLNGPHPIVGALTYNRTQYSVALLSHSIRHARCLQIGDFCEIGYRPLPSNCYLMRRSAMTVQSTGSREEQSRLSAGLRAWLTLRNEMLSQSLGDGLSSIANAELRLRLLKVTADRLRAEAERLGSVLGLRAG